MSMPTWPKNIERHASEYGPEPVLFFCIESISGCRVVLLGSVGSLDRDDSICCTVLGRPGCFGLVEIFCRVLATRGVSLRVETYTADARFVAVLELALVLALYSCQHHIWTAHTSRVEK